MIRKITGIFRSFFTFNRICYYSRSYKERLFLFNKNNPLCTFIILFFILILFLNNIIISRKQYNTIQHPDYYLFPKFETTDEKYNYQQKLFNKLKSNDFVEFKIHTVQMKENYWRIAKSNDINIDTVIGLNPYLNNLYAAVNEKIIIGNKQGCLHFVQDNENIFSIAELYAVNINQIKKANNINIFTSIFFPVKEGDILFIPDGKPKYLTEEMQKYYEMRHALQSPLGGRYTSSYGTRLHPVYKSRKFHYGLDIKAYTGQPVGAANSGIVTCAGWAGGYGKYVKIDHDNGYTTSYGHLSRIYVRTGQRVSQGQIIGRAGNTGTSTGSHLDFRVWYKGKPQDPAKYLW